MGILNTASMRSTWRGYEYYTEKKVLCLTQTGEHEYRGRVAGTAKEPYQVKINTAHVYQSACDCPHAAGRPHLVCKHMVALYFAAFPDEAADYLEEIEASEREEAENWERHLVSIRKYVMGLSKAELREALFEARVELEQQQYEYDWD